MSHIAVIGSGPAGLMAAEVVAGRGHDVVVFDAMPSAGRKLLMAGKSGLNITHSEAAGRFMSRFGAMPDSFTSAIRDFDADAVIAWCGGLGVETFTGTSGRVFPEAMKASPLLRAWLERLGMDGVQLKTRHRWTGIVPEGLRFETPQGSVTQRADATVLALGGASWPRLGSDAGWVPVLEDRGIAVAPFRPANCGFEIDWSPIFVERFAGMPVKAVVASSDAGTVPGEFVITSWGIEGSLVYAHSAALRDALEQGGPATLTLDLAPGRSAERLAKDIGRMRPKESFANKLRKGAGLDGVKAGLVREIAPDAGQLNPDALAQAVKALPLAVRRPRPIEEAISTAGGVAWDSVDETFMLKALPGVFVAGEMLDWEAPTGGYLLTACLATGRAAGLGAATYVEQQMP